MNNQFSQFRINKIYRRTIRIFGSRLFFDHNCDLKKSIMVAGTGRSGTTWLADMIAAQIPCRILFEPFNSSLVKEYRQFNYFQFMRPEQVDDALYAFSCEVFTGKIRDRWIDRVNENIFPKFRLIKEIRGNLLLGWIHENFNEIPITFIIRHPCAVVLSRMELGWATDTDIEPFLKQPNLINDFLQDHVDFIRNVKSDEEKHAVIWCVSNLVPIKQCADNQIKIVFYENLCMQPSNEISEVFKYIHKDNTALRTINPDLPSTTSSGRSAVVSGGNKISRWKDVLTTSQINRIQQVVRRFNLDYLYGDSLTPLI